MCLHTVIISFINIHPLRPLLILFHFYTLWRIIGVGLKNVYNSMSLDMLKKNTLFWDKLSSLLLRHTSTLAKPLQWNYNGKHWNNHQINSEIKKNWSELPISINWEGTGRGHTASTLWKNLPQRDWYVIVQAIHNQLASLKALEYDTRVSACDIQLGIWSELAAEGDQGGPPWTWSTSDSRWSLPSWGQWVLGKAHPWLGLQQEPSRDKGSSLC